MGEPDNVRYLVPRHQIVDKVQEWILRRGLRVGDPLPPEREVARSLRAPAKSVRDAFGVLEAAGVLERGAHGETLAGGEQSSALGTLLRLHLSLSPFELRDLLSVRIDLERASAARAAMDGTEPELVPLREAVETMHRDGVRPAEFGELDCAFHLSVARAGHNHLAVLLLSSLDDAMKREMRAGYGRSPDWPHTARALAAEHEAILDAIERRSPTQAADAVASHISRFYQLRAG